jgi:hypothetical protein
MLKDAVPAAVLATTALPSCAAQIEVHGGTTIAIDGKIEPDDFETFKVKAGPLGKAIVVLASPGGSLLPDAGSASKGCLTPA